MDLEQHLTKWALSGTKSNEEGAVEATLNRQLSKVGTVGTKFGPQFDKVGPIGAQFQPSGHCGGYIWLKGGFGHTIVW